MPSQNFASAIKDPVLKNLTTRSIVAGRAPQWTVHRFLQDPVGESNAFLVETTNLRPKEVYKNLVYRLRMC